MNVVEYQTSISNPDIADMSSARPIIRISHPQTNHNGGWIGFGPDGFLYIAQGDGGNGNDFGSGHIEPTGNSQEISNNLLGKMLRIDVDGDDFPLDANRNYAIPTDNPFVNQPGDDEIWAYGLRNPWRVSFDRVRGDFYIADVGQNAREEINFQPSSSIGGENYGWRLREGTIENPNFKPFPEQNVPFGGPRPPGNVDPIYDYTRGNGLFQGRSVTGGYVYRGPVAALRGNYFFADIRAFNLWSFPVSGDGVPDPTQVENWNSRIFPESNSPLAIASFAEDARGNLYAMEINNPGGLYLFEDLVTPPNAQVPALPITFAWILAAFFAAFGVFQLTAGRD